ncbi:MAG: preprotein translocase subunit YajC [Bacteroidota bacterium]
MTYLLLQAIGGGTINLLFLGLMGFVFYFFMIRPQVKRQSEQSDFNKSLEKGDTVVSASGIVGKINKLDDKTVTLEVGKVFLPMLRNAISKEMTDAYHSGEEQA